MVNPPRDADVDDESEPVSRWRATLEELLDEAKDYTRRKPMEGLLASFAAGLLLSSLFRRDR